MATEKNLPSEMEPSRVFDSRCYAASLHYFLVFIFKTPFDTSLYSFILGLN